MAKTFKMARRMLTNRKIIKTGIGVTAGAAWGGYLGAIMYGDPATRQHGGKSAAIAAGATTIAATGAVLARKPIGKFIKGGVKAVVKFRRIRGRVVPIRVKG